jgi:hypothetical protein
MSTKTPSEFLTREEYPEATLFRIATPNLPEGPPLVALMEAIGPEAALGNRPVILDFAAVEYLGSAALACLVKLRTQFRQRGGPFQPPARRGWLVFTVFPDPAAALEAVHQGEPDPLLLCGVRPEVAEVFCCVRGEQPGLTIKSS